MKIDPTILGRRLRVQDVKALASDLGKSYSGSHEVGAMLLLSLQLDRLCCAVEALAPKAPEKPPCKHEQTYVDTDSGFLRCVACCAPL